MPTLCDDLGYPLDLAGPPQRIVSLVPSLTEAIAVTVPGRLAGATDWCTHPAGLDVPRVRGTKNPDVAAVIALRPDVVLANEEENRAADLDALRAAGLPVWVTVIRTLDEALASLRRLLTVACRVPAPSWLDQAEQAWAVRLAGGPAGPGGPGPARGGCPPPARSAPRGARGPPPGPPPRPGPPSGRSRTVSRPVTVPSASPP